MPDDATSPNGQGPETGSESDTSSEAIERRYLANAIAEFGACSMWVDTKPHCWHPVADPITNQYAELIPRLCCWCAPEGLQVVVRIKTLNPEIIVTERSRHGRGVTIHRIDPDSEPEQPAEPERPAPVHIVERSNGEARTRGGLVVPGYFSQ